MQTDEHRQKLVLISKIPAYVEQRTGDRPHIATIHRWYQRGCKGIKLQTAFAGGHRRTTEAWVDEFFEAVTAKANDRELGAAK